MKIINIVLSIFVLLLFSGCSEKSEIEISETMVKTEEYFKQLSEVDTVATSFDGEKASATFGGQGSLSFTYKAKSSGSEKVRVYVKNNGAKEINYKLISPSGTAWISSSIAPGKQMTTEHVFDAGQAGDWKMSFSNSDGSSISVDASFRAI